MPNLTGAGVGISYGVETTWGDDASVATLQTVEVNAFTLTPSAEFYSDTPIVNDRMPRTPRKGNTGVGGDVGVNLRHGAYDELIEAALLGAFVADVAKAGTTEKSVLFNADLNDVSRHLQYVGNRVTSWNVSVPLSGVVTSTFSFAGKEVTDEAAAVATPAVAVSKEPFYHGQGTFTEGGTTIAHLTAINFTLANGYAPNYSLGSIVPSEMTYATVGLTGEVTAYVPNLVLFNKFLNETESSLSFTLTDPSGNTITFDMPKVKYSGAPLTIDDDQAVELTLPFTAYYDATEETVLKVTRS
tara:strand:- start:8308 stop:9207 length:900 start_codon:yes stop_codon:yes gene_type:complete